MGEFPRDSSWKSITRWVHPKLKAWHGDTSHMAQEHAMRVGTQKEKNVNPAASGSLELSSSVNPRGGPRPSEGEPVGRNPATMCVLGLQCGLR